MTFLTFKSCLLMYSHMYLGIYYCTLLTTSYPKTLSYSPLNLPFLLFSPLLAPYGIFDYFPESIWGAIILPALVLDSAQTMHGPAEQLIPRNSVETVAGFDYVIIIHTQRSA